MKKLFRNLFKKLGYQILSRKNLLLQIRDFYDDQFALLKIANVKNPVIFDVGAHQGETALKYNELFKNDCTIHSFEPFPDSYEILKQKTRGSNNIHSYNIAFTNYTGESGLNVNAFSGTNSLLETDPSAEKTWNGDILQTLKNITVDCSTLDDFTYRNSINKIDILKIDTQGTEYNVIAGAKNILERGDVKIIFIEILNMPTYKEQNSMDELFNLLRLSNYKLYNIYNSANEHLYYYTRFGQLRQMDAIFINEEMQERIF